MNINRNISLFAGVMAGLGAALFSLFQQGRSLPDYAVASVNDRYITRAVYERALGAVDADKRNSLSAEDRQRVLNRLIDEELLIQYGLQQGLVRSDRQVKSTLVQSVIQAKSLEAEARDISDAQARDFFEANRTLFAQTERIRVGLIRIPVDGAETDASRKSALEAREKLLAGAAFEQVAAEYHQGGVLNLPNTLLPRRKLVDYLGPNLADIALSLEAGGVADPVLVGRAWQLLFVHERITAPAPRFEAVSELVLAEIRRRASETALRSTLNDMRETESIVIAEDVRE